MFRYFCTIHFATDRQTEGETNDNIMPIAVADHSYSYSSATANRAYTRGNRRRNRSERSSRRLSRRQLVARLHRCSSPRRSPVVYTGGDLCAIVAATITATIAATVASCIHYRRSLPRRSLRQSRRRSPRVGLYSL